MVSGWGFKVLKATWRKQLVGHQTFECSQRDVPMHRIASLYQRTSHHSCMSYHITSYIPLYDHLFFPSEGTSPVGYLCWLPFVTAKGCDWATSALSYPPPPATTKVAHTTAAQETPPFTAEGPGSQLVSNAWSLWPTKDTDTSTTWTSPRSLPEMINLNWRTLSAFSFTTFISPHEVSEVRGVVPLYFSQALRLSVLQQFHQTHVRVSNLSHTAATPAVDPKEITQSFPHFSRKAVLKVAKTPHVTAQFPTATSTLTWTKRLWVKQSSGSLRT